MTRFLPSLSEITPPGSCTKRVVRDVSVVSKPMLPLVPPSSRIYSPQKGRQRNIPNMYKLWVMVTAITFLLETTVLIDCVKFAKVYTSG